MINIFGEMNGTPPLSWYATDAPPPAQGWAAQSQQDLDAVEGATSTTDAAGESVGEGLAGAAGEAGFLASPADLVAAISPIGLAVGDGVLLVHDGKLLFNALFGSFPAASAPPGSGVSPMPLIGWYSDGSQGGTLGASFTNPFDRDILEQTMGDALWNSPGWWAEWSEGVNNVSVDANFEPPIMPAPTIGTRVDFNGRWGTHAYYLLPQDLGGSIQPWSADSPQPDVTVQAPALPSEAQAATDLNTDLAQPEYHTLRLELQHVLDPRCSPDPTQTTVQVPAILPDETPSDYQSCLTTLGLSANVTTLTETDTTVGSGDVVETSPESESSVQPGTTVDVATNPQTPQVSQPDPRCDVDGGAGSPGDPGNPPPDGTNYPAYQLVQNSPYPVAVDPTGESPAQTEIPLRWGTTRWGWRHILRKHPYTSADQQQTMQALATDAEPTPGGFSATNQWDFHLFYTEPDGSGGTIQCLRTVRVEYFQDPQAASASVQGIRGINNSYTGLYEGNLPGH